MIADRYRSIKNYVQSIDIDRLKGSLDRYKSGVDRLKGSLDRRRSIETADRFKSIDQSSESIYTIDFQA